MEGTAVKHRRVLGVVIPLAVVVFVGLLVTMAWARGMGGHGGFHGGFGGFQGGLTPPGLQRGFVHPGVQGFSHFDHFQQGLLFGPHHHGGGFQRDFFFSNRGFFFGPPLFPLSPHAAVVIRSPFFCFPEGLEFTDQALFFEHLHQVHGIPFEQAGFFCRQLLGGRLIFFGF
jgi:hypothetical protein